MKKNDLPRIVAGLGIILLFLCLAGCGRKPAREAGAARLIKVSVAQPEERVFRSALRVQGTVRAVDRARVAARVAGTIEEVFVDEGAAVEAGRPLFQTDKASLESKVQIERDNLKVAAASRAEAQAALAEARAVFAKAELDYGRFQKLYRDDKAVTLNALEQAETAFKSAEAGLLHARAVVDLAKAREAQARSALEIAEKQLADSTVTAPFQGTVTRKLVELGEYASAGAAVFELEDPARLEAVFVLSAEYYGRVETNRTRLRIARGAEPVEAAVTYKAPSVHPVTRTFEVRAALPDARGYAPGMLCDVDVTLDEHRGWGLPTAAIGLRGGQAVVFAVEEDRAVLTPVRPGPADNGFTELLDADALLDRGFVVEGQAFLNDGDRVRLD
ncbi:MAG: efflux RND transporter periplasmic adaptor subunit [Kiritimatiellae bacterium]|nr:efflux RND transporter periplasmic adaptor subunit [Kiritimatiellia bacterium]